MDHQLDRAWQRRLTMVVGPAGAGKTTAASHLVDRSAGPTVWYRAQAIDADEQDFCAHLGESIASSLGVDLDWVDVDQAAVDLDRLTPDGGLLIVIDEFDALIGGTGEQRFADLLGDLRPDVHLVTLSRSRPQIARRLPLGDDVAEIGPDDLRFRSWEIDRLFRELYARPLPPDQVAELERRSGGWVAALQLFDLATSHLPPELRKAAITNVGRQTGPDWDYLAENVLAGLPDEQRRFLLETSPLERLTADLCDDLLGERSSWRRLHELEERQLLSSATDIPGGYRCHEVLRTHLEGLLIESEGAEAVRKRHQRAAHLLEDRGRFAEALRAFCRADDWTSAARLLGLRGQDLAARPGGWLDGLPRTFLETDPWLQLARARQLRNDGRLAEATRVYTDVERSSLSQSLQVLARNERFVAAALLEPTTRAPVTWVGLIREAAIGASMPASTRTLPHEQLAVGLGLLVAGEVRRAETALRSARDGDDAPAAVVLSARLALTMASFLRGRRDHAEIQNVERMAAALDLPFFGRLALAISGMVSGSREVVDSVRTECVRIGDRAGAALCDVVDAVTAASATDGGQLDARSATRCRALGFTALVYWIDIARLFGDDPDRPRADEVELAARRHGLRTLADIAMLIGRTGDDRVRTAARQRLADDHRLLLMAIDDRTEPVESDAPVRVRCLGGFEVHIGDEQLDISTLRPRARAVLKMLSVHPGRGLHRDVLCEALWTDDEPKRAMKKLQVAISSIRRLFADHGRESIILRSGESYRIAPDVAIDLERLDGAIRRAEATSPDEDEAGFVGAAEEVCRLHADELLPEEPSADWALDARRRTQAAASGVMKRLAQHHVSGGRTAASIEVTTLALRHDRWNDALWRLLLGALEAEGDLAELARQRTRYNEVLIELGVDPADSWS